MGTSLLGLFGRASEALLSGPTGIAELILPLGMILDTHFTDHKILRFREAKQSQGHQVAKLCLNPELSESKGSLTTPQLTLDELI